MVIGKNTIGFTTMASTTTLTNSSATSTLKNFPRYYQTTMKSYVIENNSCLSVLYSNTNQCLL